jgi:phospholipid transport system substrate-binding protein
MHRIVLPSLLLLTALFLFALPAASSEMAAVSASTPSPAATASPQQVVEDLHRALIETMQMGKQASFVARVAHIEPVVERTFDVDYMGAKCVGRYWKKLDDAQKQHWRTQFKGLLTANYAGNFKEHDGERFETLGEEPSTRSTRIVMTQLVVPGEDDVAFNYRLREVDGRWRIIDVYLKGTVSELALRRSDFSSILKREGFEELTTAVENKIEKLRKKGS